MDARQRRSRDRLYKTVLRLASDRPAGQITVSELAREAGLHRSTVYEHGSSTEDLLRQALLADLDELRRGLLADPSGDARQMVADVTMAVMEHIERHVVIYRRDLAHGGAVMGLRPMLGEHFLESGRLLMGLARLRIEVAVPAVSDEVVADLAARLIADGTVGAIAGWLEHPELGVADFMRTYIALLPMWWPLARL